MNSLEGKRGNPRIKPPFPAVAGVFGMPDHDQQRRDPRRRSAHHQARRGLVQGAVPRQPKSTGTKLFCVSGHVRRPGNYEVTLGFPLQGADLRPGRRHAGGPDAQGRDPRRLVGADPDRDEIEMRCSGLRGRASRQGTMLGSGGVIVMDDCADMVKQMCGWPDFYAHESLRPVHAVPRGHRAGWSRSCERILAGRGQRRRTSTCCSISPRT